MIQDRFKFYVDGVDYDTIQEAEAAVSAWVEITYADEDYYDADYGDDLFNEYQNQIKIVDSEGNTYTYDEFYSNFAYEIMREEDL